MAGMENNSEGRRDGVWAQPYSLASGQTQHHQLGHIRLWVTLLDQEWQIRSETLELDTDPASWTETIGHTLPSASVPLQRFIRENQSSTVTFLPALANMPTCHLYTSPSPRD